MFDLFHALMVRSDLVIAALRKPHKPKGPINHRVLLMLLRPNSDGTFPAGQETLQIVESDDSDID